MLRFIGCLTDRSDPLTPQLPLRATLLTLGAVLTAALCTAPPAAQAASSADPPASAAPSSHTPTATVALDPATGRPTLAVSRNGVQVVTPSPVGLITEHADLSADLKLTGRDSRTVDETYRTTTGKARVRHVHARETTYHLRAKSAAGTRLDLVVRETSDGIAYRYRLPGATTAATGNVLREASSFTFPADTDAWLGVYRQDNENAFKQYTAAGAPSADYSMQGLFRTGSTYALIAESDLSGSYAGARLTHTAGSSSYGVGLWNNEPVQVTAGKQLATPWRAIITGSLATVTESTMIDDLAPASRVKDTSWIKPGPALWTWLAGGKEAGQSLAAQEKYVDYAAERGWPYEVVDAGWYYLPGQWEVIDPEWQTRNWMPELVGHARERGVGIQVWLHYTLLTDPVEREKWLSTLERWGVKGVKIDFMDSESQTRFKWYDDILRATAKHHLMVNFHGSTIPKGVQRTWPQVMTMEGVGGEEKRTNTAEHLAVLPFTRNAIGSMDFTPGAFHRPYRPNVNSDAGELGLSVLYESGITNLAGTPESYDQRPVARGYLEQLPRAWDATKLLVGDPGKAAVLAREAAGRWFIGGTFAGAARTVDVPLRLGAGRWLVETVTDGPSGLVRTPRVVGGTDTLSVPVVADGGFAALACRWHPGRTTCDR
ncbi:glycoside hydrolase family 97 catalytic domain-containing protein [Streptomyces sp. NPDC102467]|uniref:glycoside hydrolase family 97 protein n=1 Tax=Streptomyces sp. NPDC102467 TaxID=3366179 RepID=UPI00381C8A28